MVPLLHACMRVLSLQRKTCPGHQPSPAPRRWQGCVWRAPGQQGLWGFMRNLPCAAPLTVAMLGWSEQTLGAAGAKPPCALESGSPPVQACTFLSLSASRHAMPARILPSQKQHWIFTQSRGEGERGRAEREEEQDKFCLLQFSIARKDKPSPAPLPRHRMCARAPSFSWG